MRSTPQSPSNDTTPENLAQSGVADAIGLRLLRMVDWWINAMDVNTRALGIPTLSRSQAMLCAHIGLGEHRPIRLAEALGITRQAVHFVISQLVDLGIVEVRDDPDDRRATIVELSAPFSGDANDYQQVMHALEAHIEERFGAEDFASFRKIARADWGEIPKVTVPGLERSDSVAD